MRYSSDQYAELKAEGAELARVRKNRGLRCGDIGPVCLERWTAQAVGKWEAGLVSMPKKLWTQVFQRWDGHVINTPRLTPFPEETKRKRIRNKIIRGKKRPTWSVRTPYLPIRNPFAG